MKQDNNTINKIEYNYVDYIKFFFAVIVVLSHICDVYGINSLLGRIIKFITLIAVSYYFIASSFFLFKGNVSKAKIIKYIKRILILYTFWTVTFLPFRISEIMTIGFDFKGILIYILKYIRIFLFIGEYQLWFLVGTLWALFMILIFRKINFNEKMIAVVAVIMFMLMQAIDLELLPYNNIFATLWKVYFTFFGTTRNGIFVGFIYMTMGLLVANNVQLQNINRKILSAISILLLVFGGVLFIKAYTIETWLLPAIVIVIFLWSINSGTTEEGSAFAKIARQYSTLIYVSHMTILEGLLCIGKLNIVVECIVVLGVTIAIAWVVTAASKKIRWLRYVY